MPAGDDVEVGGEESARMAEDIVPPLDSLDW